MKVRWVVAAAGLINVVYAEPAHSTETSLEEPLIYPFRCLRRARAQC